MLEIKYTYPSVSFLSKIASEFLDFSGGGQRNCKYQLILDFGPLTTYNTAHQRYGQVLKEDISRYHGNYFLSYVYLCK